MNRIDQRFKVLGQSGRVGLVPYITAGHPRPDATVRIMHAAVAAGADLLELGMPFSDVMADGPVIQNACARALENGTGLTQVLDMVRDFRRTDADTPVILMGYTNPIERRGPERFAREAAEAGVDGLLVVDCPSDEAADLCRLLSEQGLHQIFLIAPTTNDQRLAQAARLAGGFVYYVAIKGVTGAATLDLASLAPMIEQVRAGIGLPVAVGFGIRDPDQAAAAAESADAVVIGSALVDRLDRCETAEEAARVTRDFLAPVRQAMDNGASLRANNPEDKAINVK